MWEVEIQKGRFVSTYFKWTRYHPRFQPYSLDYFDRTVLKLLVFIILILILKLILILTHHPHPSCQVPIQVWMVVVGRSSSKLRQLQVSIWWRASGRQLIFPCNSILYFYIFVLLLFCICMFYFIVFVMVFMNCICWKANAMYFYLFSYYCICLCICVKEEKRFLTSSEKQI